MCLWLCTNLFKWPLYFLFYLESTSYTNLPRGVFAGVPWTLPLARDLAVVFAALPLAGDFEVLLATAVFALDTLAGGGLDSECESLSS